MLFLEVFSSDGRVRAGRGRGSRTRATDTDARGRRGFAGRGRRRRRRRAVAGHADAAQARVSTARAGAPRLDVLLDVFLAPEGVCDAAAFAPAAQESGDPGRRQA